jgi:hypothetical protein
MAVVDMLAVWRRWLCCMAVYVIYDCWHIMLAMLVKLVGSLCWLC